ncbi:MAG: O-antigen polysaccharide polymerase Wzy [bacterium]|nr:O-antigen polysaccharide polymerase Wzy [bacterium]
MRKISKCIYLWTSIPFTIALLVRYFTVDNDISGVEVKGGCLYLLILYVISEYVWVNTTKRFFAPFSLFLIMCLIFNAGQLILYLFDIEIQNWYVIVKHYSTDTMLKMIYFQSLCVIGMTSGALLAYNRKVKQCFEYSCPPQNNKTHWNQMDNIDIVFYLIAIIAIGYSLMRLLLRSQYGYMNQELETNGSSWVSLLEYIFFILFYYEMSRYHKEEKNKITLIIGIIFVLIKVLYGKRNYLLYIVGGIVFIYLYVYKKQSKIKKWQIVLGIVISLVGFSAMRGLTLLRNYSLHDINFQLIEEVYSGGILNGLYGTLAEFGKSANCLLTTMQSFFNEEVTHAPTIPYALLLGFVPKKVTSLFINDPVSENLSIWVTGTIGAASEQGFSLYAEAFYNFNIWGFLFLLAFGFTIVKLEYLVMKNMSSKYFIKRIYSCSILYLIVYCAFLARGELRLISTPIRRCFYIWIIMLLLSSRRASKRVR